MESLLKTKTTSSISILNKRGNAGNGLSGKFHNLRARESVSMMHDIAISNKKAIIHSCLLQFRGLKFQYPFLIKYDQMISQSKK